MTIASTGGTTTLGLYDTQSQLKEKADITYVDNKVDPLQAGHKGYATLAQAQAAQSGLVANTVVEVLSDTTEVNNGYYLWNGTTLTKTTFSPLTQANNYTDVKVATAKAEAISTASSDATTKSNNAVTTSNNYTDSLFAEVPSVVEPYVVQAQAAATAANIAGKVYATPSEGVDPITGVPSGQYFNVRSSSNDNYIDEYLNNSGVAQSTGKSYPSSSFVSSIAEFTALPFKSGSSYDINQRVKLANGDIVKSTVPNNTLNPNTDMTGWVKVNDASQIIDASGKTQQEVNNNLLSRVVYLSDYVLSTDNFDASLALFRAVNVAKSKTSARIDFGPYEWMFKSKVTINNLNNIILDASAAKIIDTLNVDEVILFNNAKNVRFHLNTVEGSATHENHIADGAKFTNFIKFVNSTDCRVFEASVSKMRTLVQFYDCTNCRAYDNTGVGFLPAVDFSVFIENTNYLPLVSFSGGKFNKASGNHAEFHGSCVLYLRNSYAPISHSNTGENLHDNGVYGSSTNSSIAFANSFNLVRGTGVKPRGSNNIAVLNTVSNATMGISSTGNGDADVKGANGFGNIVALNSTDATRDFSVSVDLQDNLYSRNVIVALNVAKGHLGTGVNAPYRINAVEGHVVVGNTFEEHGADYGILMIATSTKAINKSGVLAFNVTSSTKPLARSTYGQYGVHVGNLNTNGVGVQYRYQETTLALANVATAAAISDTPTYPCSNMTYVGNAGAATNIASQSTAVVAANKAIVNLIDATTLTPLPVQAGLLARDAAGASYISTLTGSTLSWKKITTS